MKRQLIQKAFATALALVLAGSLLQAGPGAAAKAEETPGSAKLQNLILDKVPLLEPAFSPDTFSYTAETYYSVQDVTVYPIRQAQEATVTVNGTAETKNGVKVSVNTGSNTLQIMVKNGTQSNTYTVALTKLETDYRGRKPITTPITATTDFGNQADLANMFDGNPNTYWTPAQKPVSEAEGTPTSFLLDFGQVYKVSRIRAVMTNNQSGWIQNTPVRISVSADGTNWSIPIVNGVCIASHNVIRYELGKTYDARYLKFEWTKYAINNIIRINEFTVFEDVEDANGQVYPPPEGGDTPFQPTNSNIARGQEIVIEKGYPISGWSNSAGYGRAFLQEKEAELFGWDGPLFFEPPLGNADYMAHSPNAHWGMAKAPWGANGMGAAGDPRDFVPESMKPYINNAISFCFGDEGSYSLAEAQRYGRWFNYSKENYPGTIVHSNQSAGIGWDNLSVWRQYMQTAQPDLLSFDDYYGGLQNESTQWNASNSLLSTNLWKLQRQAALEGVDGTGQKPILFGQYLDVYRNDQPMSHKNLVVNLSLLSGMKWLNYFMVEYQYGGCYLFDEDGAPTHGLYEWGEVNRYIKTVDQYILRLNNDWVVSQPGKHGNTASPVSNSAASGWHMGSFAGNTAKNTEYHIADVSARNLTQTNNGLPGDVVMGYFNALPGLEESELQSVFGCKAPKAFMVMNGLIAGSSGLWNNLNILGKEKGSAENTRQEITLTFAGNEAGTLRKVNRNTGMAEEVTIGEDNTYTFTLGGGEADLFYWMSDAPDERVWTLNLNDNVLGSGINQFDYDDTWYYREPDRGDFPTHQGNDIHVTSIDGGTATLRFYGSGIDLYLRKQSAGGVASIQLDDGTPVEVDTSNAQALNGSSGGFPILYSRNGLENALHTLIVTFEGDKGDSTSAYKGISIDSAAITYTGSIPKLEAGSEAKLFVNDTSRGAGKNQFTFSEGWTTSQQTSGTNTGWTHTSTAGSYYELRFNGTAATIYSLPADLGEIKVYLDGQLLEGVGYSTFTDTWPDQQPINYPRPVLKVQAGSENADHVLKVEAVSGLSRVDCAVVSQAVAGTGLNPGKDLDSVLARAKATGFCYEFSGEEQNFDGTRTVNGTSEDIARLKASQKGTLLVRFSTTSAASQVVIAAGKDTGTEHYGALLANAVSNVNLMRIDFPDGMHANLPNTNLRDGAWHTFVYSVDAANLTDKQGKTVTSFDGGTTTRFPDFASWFNQNTEINDLQFLSIGGVEGTLHFSSNNANFNGKIAFVAFIPETFTQEEASVLSGN